MTNSALHPIRLVKAILSFEDYRSNPYGVTESDMQEYHAMHTSAFDFGDPYRYPEAAQALAVKEAQQRAWADEERDRNRTYSDPERAEGELMARRHQYIELGEETQIDDPESAEGYLSAYAAPYTDDQETGTHAPDCRCFWCEY